MESYISNLETELEGNNLKAEPLILASNGGVLPMDQAAENPVWTVDSGPTLLPVGVHRLLEMDMGEDNIVAVDMGGTSLDIGVVKEGKVPRTREAKIGDDFMLGIDKVDVRSVGAGGGSIAWIDEGGLLHIGPQSSGSDPGPICYQRGGNQPTVTDAVISLGYYNEDYFLGGEMDVSRQAALDGIEEELSQDLGVDTIEAAYSVYKTTIQNIVQGLQDMTLERGIDPRNYVLSGGGGALGAFAVPVARELDIEEIYLPKDAGVVSSIGGVLTDIKKDFSASYYTRHSEFDLEKVNSILASLESDAETFFETMEIPERDRTFKFYSEARYENQVWDLEIEIPSHANDSGISLTEDDLPEIEERFHQVHEDTHGFRAPDEIEFLNWRLEGIGQTQTPEFNVSDGLQSEDVDNAKVGERDAYFDREMVPTPVYRTNQLSPGHSLEGPAIVEEKTHTLVLPPESELEITEFNNFYINP